jgi:hypothetical protein
MNASDWGWAIDDRTIEFKKKNLSTKEHEDPRREVNILILIVSALSSCFFV